MIPNLVAYIELYMLSLLAEAERPWAERSVLVTCVQRHNIRIINLFSICIGICIYIEREVKAIIYAHTHVSQYSGMAQLHLRPWSTETPCMLFKNDRFCALNNSNIYSHIAGLNI